MITWSHDHMDHHYNWLPMHHMIISTIFNHITWSPLSLYLPPLYHMIIFNIGHNHLWILRKRSPVSFPTTLPFVVINHWPQKECEHIHHLPLHNKSLVSFATTAHINIHNCKHIHYLLHSICLPLSFATTALHDLIHLSQPHHMVTNIIYLYCTTWSDPLKSTTTHGYQ